MNYHYLAIDFGESNVGFAVSNGSLAKPLPIFKYPQGSYQFLRIHILELLRINKPVVIVVGIPANENSSSKIKHIFLSLIFEESELRQKIVWANEDFSTQEATLLKKRKRLREDSIAASIILENYINNITN